MQSRACFQYNAKAPVHGSCASAYTVWLRLRVPGLVPHHADTCIMTCMTTPSLCRAVRLYNAAWHTPYNASSSSVAPFLQTVSVPATAHLIHPLPCSQGKCKTPILSAGQPISQSHHDPATPTVLRGCLRQWPLDCPSCRRRNRPSAHSLRPMRPRPRRTFRYRLLCSTLSRPLAAYLGVRQSGPYLQGVEGSGAGMQVGTAGAVGRGARVPIPG